MMQVLPALRDSSRFQLLWPTRRVREVSKAYTKVED